MSQDEVSVESIMRKKVPVVAPDDTVGTVASMMANSDVPGVLVVDDGELLGIITESDIVTRKAEVDFPETVSFLGGYFRAGRLQLPWNRETHDDASDFDHEIRRVLATTARDLMTSPVINIDKDATILDLATIMIEHNVNPVPVVTDDNKIVGIVSRKDLVKLIATEQQSDEPDDDSTV
jgi:CBS domain-containing protein